MSRASQTKGVKAERDFCAGVRPYWPRVERSVRTGYRRPAHTPDDIGDILNTGAVVFQVKDWTGPKTDAIVGMTLDRLLAETDRQRDVAGGKLGVLVEKRKGQALALNWHAHVDVFELSNLAIGRRPDEWPGPMARVMPVRIRVGDLVDLLDIAGWAEKE